MNDEALKSAAKAHDREEASRYGEPSPWEEYAEEIDPEWVEHRITCMRAALEALMEAGFVVMPADSVMTAETEQARAERLEADRKQRCCCVVDDSRVVEWCKLHGGQIAEMERERDDARRSGFMACEEEWRKTLRVSDLGEASALLDAWREDVQRNRDRAERLEAENRQLKEDLELCEEDEAILRDAIITHKRGMKKYNCPRAIDLIMWGALAESTLGRAIDAQLANEERDDV